MIGIALLLGACVTGLALGAPAEDTLVAETPVNAEIGVPVGCTGCWEYKDPSDPRYLKLVEQALALSHKNYGIYRIESVREQVVNGYNYDIMFIPVGNIELCDITFYVAPNSQFPQDIKTTCLAVQR